MLRIAIPARRGSTRLPDKMLARIGAETVVRMAMRRVVEAVALTGFDAHAVLATDDHEIAAEARGLMNVVMTFPEARTGTDRVADAAAQLGWPGDAIVVNVQADMPFLDPSHLAGFLVAANRGSGGRTSREGARVSPEGGDWEMLTGFCEHPLVRVGYPHFSREAPLCHVGLYAYTGAALRRFASLPTSDGEQLFRLEQMRAVQAGFRIAYHAMPAMPLEINTPEDLAAAQRMAACLGVAA